MFPILMKKIGAGLLTTLGVSIVIFIGTPKEIYDHSIVIAINLLGVTVKTNRIERKNVKNRLIITQKDLEKLI